MMKAGLLINIAATAIIYGITQSLGAYKRLYINRCIYQRLMWLGLTFFTKIHNAHFYGVLLVTSQ